MRSKKFYSNNEKQVMKEYGLNPVFASGAGWVDKEDGENDFVMAQLKSTDALSYRITLDDLDKLNYHAAISHKMPVFIIEFLQRGEKYFLIKPENVCDLSKLLELPKNRLETKIEPHKGILDELNNEDETRAKRKIVKSSKSGKEKILKEQGKLYANNFK